MSYFYQSADTTDQTYSVAQINRQVKQLLEEGVGAVWIEAEVSELTEARSGHIYFTLADAAGDAQLRAVMWRGHAGRYRGKLQRGAALRCHGRLTLYEARGTYQFVVDRVEEAGDGLRARRLEELKKRLAAEGLFDADRKRPLPTYPLCVGVVTSRSGAAIRDICKVARRRFPVRILLAHAAVQGASAPKEIAAALDRLAEREEPDVVIVGRGGGSAEDLDAFNAEEVVRAIARHPRPVVSAVGHEVDVTLSDLAADRRAATPSEAAELVVADAMELRADLEAYTRSCARALAALAAEHRRRLDAASARVRALDPRLRLRRSALFLASARQTLSGWPELWLLRKRESLRALDEGLFSWTDRLDRDRAQLESLVQRLLRWPEPALRDGRARLGTQAASLEALSPLGSLSRGYSVVRRAGDGAIVRDAAQVEIGQDVDVALARGGLRCRITAKA